MKTNSRYDFMAEGVVADEVSGSLYPDPLSLNYLNLEMSSNPSKDELNDSKIISLWKEAQNLYGFPGYDDIVLTLNGVEHKNFLIPGDILYFPATEDIENSFNKEA